MADDTEAKQGGTKPQIAIYQKVAAREDEILDTLFELLSSRNESVAVAAAKTLLNKILPDRKAVEVTGQDGEPIKFYINTGTGFVPPRGSALTTSETGYSSGSSEVQGDNLAPQSTKDNNSDNRGDQAGVSS